MKYLVFDLDGTMLNDDLTIPTDLEKILYDLKKKYYIVIATGRSIIGLPESILRLKKLISFYITSNGTTIYNNKMEVIGTNYISNNDAVTIIKSIKKLSVIPELLINGKWYIDFESENKFGLLKIEQEILNYILKTRIKVPNLCQWLKNTNNSVEKINLNIYDSFSDTRKSIDSIVSNIGLKEWTDKKHKIDVYGMNVSKGDALKCLSKILNVSLKDFVSFGNDENDIEMFDNCGISICMFNASPDVKKHANYVFEVENKDRIKWILLKMIEKNIL